MEFLEKFLGRFRNVKQEKPLSLILPEGKSTSAVWTYEHFREYLLAISRGRAFLLEPNSYPDLIELNGDWHLVLETMHHLTSTKGSEYFSPLVFKENSRSIALASKPFRGIEGSVGTEVQLKALSKAKEVDLTGIIGSIHTHPTTNKNDSLTFSAGDLYTLVVPGSKELISGIVGSYEMLFDFQTRQTQSTGFNQNILSQEAFSKYWYEKYGFRYLGRDPITGAQLTSSSTPVTTWSVNIGIAERHKIVLYSGDLQRELVKVYPPIASNPRG